MQSTLADRLLPAALRRMPVRHCALNRYYLVLGNALELLRQLPTESCDLIFADPPYLLSNDGTTVRAGERVSVNKGEWDRSGGLQADYDFHRAWLELCRALLKPTGTLWVTGTQHSIYQVGFAMQWLGYHLLNTITWAKPNAAPNLGCRQFTHSTELVIWAAPAKLEPLAHTFHYGAMKAEAGGKQMRDVWTIPPPGPKEKVHGAHPTQKPLALLERIVACSSNPGDLVLDPFAGSGTTGVAAVAAGRRFIGLDLDAGYLDLAERRIREVDGRSGRSTPPGG